MFNKTGTLSAGVLKILLLLLLLLLLSFVHRLILCYFSCYLGGVGSNQQLKISKEFFHFSCRSPSFFGGILAVPNNVVSTVFATILFVTLPSASSTTGTICSFLRLHNHLISLLRSWYFSTFYCSFP